MDTQDARTQALHVAMRRYTPDIIEIDKKQAIDDVAAMIREPEFVRFRELAIELLADESITPETFARILHERSYNDIRAFIRDHTEITMLPNGKVSERYIA